jgi:hypothetical protein
VASRPGLSQRMSKQDPQLGSSLSRVVQSCCSLGSSAETLRRKNSQIERWGQPRKKLKGGPRKPSLAIAADYFFG